MNQVNYLKVFKSQWRLGVLLVAAVVFVGLVMTLFSPFKYRATTEVLIIESGVDSDAYSAIRSAEKIGNNLSHIVYTTSFRDRVLQTNLISEQAFSANQLQRKKEWESAIKIYVVPETGILRVEVYRTDRREATVLAEGIARVLVNSGADYIGSTQVNIKTVDEAMASTYPVTPNIPLNLLVSLALGLLFASAYSVLTYDPNKKITEKEKFLALEGAFGVTPENNNQAMVTEYIPVKSEDEESVIPVTVEEKVAEEVAEIKEEIKEALTPAEVVVASSADENTDDAATFYKMLFPEK